MNQILSVENTKNKKKKSSVHSVIIVFCIILIIFGIGLTSTGAYSYYRNLTKNIDDNIISTNSTKAVITTERVNASTINIAVEHDKGITSVVYQINDENPVELDAKNKMEFKQEVELPSGNCSIKITAKDINGITSSYESSYEVEDRPIITLEQENGKIKATIESKNNLDYVMYYWDEDQENAKKATTSKQQIETYIDVLEGTHTLNVTAKDINGISSSYENQYEVEDKPTVK